MRTWRIKNGDIAIDSTGRVEIINEAPKIVQDLRSWLLNDLGYNRFHPEMGTDLDSFVGQLINGTTLSDVRATVRTALNTYLDQQMEDLRKRVEERGDPYMAIGQAEPSSIIKAWTKLDVKELGGDILISIGFRTWTNDYEEVKLAISGGLTESGRVE